MACCEFLITRKDGQVIAGTAVLEDDFLHFEVTPGFEVPSVTNEPNWVGGPLVQGRSTRSLVSVPLRKIFRNLPASTYNDLKFLDGCWRRDKISISPGRQRLSDRRGDIASG